MKKIGLIYWPRGGNVENVASMIYDRFDKSFTDMYDLHSIKVTDLVNYSCLIIGGSTVGSETWNEVRPTNKWNDFFRDLDKINLEGKKIALFGLGDQVLWPRNFVDNMIAMKEEFEGRGAVLVGSWPTDGYDFEESRSVIDGKFIGLALDEDQQHEKTQERIDKWTDQIKEEFEI
ncbi:MAG: flavodoxin [Bacteroidales bacterium]|nr:flavodoxin [Bacteroidales bacterium]MCF8344608.1 flavodoxin [Bacteroidales bacterium]MCF8351276.1 flavodoxin [Bacteroidales bacterium]MCF8377577.1 flavodoxin [Bacteroidales bacterium]MCF8401842.1 flavodoxin [Bacteroidales bacterium]